MNTISVHQLARFNVFDRSSPVLHALYSSAVSTLDLSLADYVTIRDLVQVSKHNDDAVLHSLLIAMFISLYEGSSCLYLNGPSLKQKLGLFTPEVTPEAVLKKIQNYNGIIAKNVHTDQANTSMPLLLAGGPGDERLYFQKYYYHEKKLISNITGLLTKDEYNTDRTARVHSIVKEILDERPLIKNGAPLDVNIKQRMAIILSLMQDFLLISGGPGTGKTSIIFNILRAMVRDGKNPENIMLAAPTGRAAGKLTETIHNSVASLEGPAAEDLGILNINAMTVHRLLRYSPARKNFMHNRNNPVKAELIIIDEVSMMDIILLSHLMDSIDDETKVIFLGDKNQLPSVDTGSFLSDLVPRNELITYSKKCMDAFLKDFNGRLNISTTETPGPLTDRIVMLDTDYRSNREIQAVSDKINRQDTSALDHMKTIGTAVISDNKLFKNIFTKHEGVCIMAPGTAGTDYQWALSLLLDSWIENTFNEKYFKLIEKASVPDTSVTDDETRFDEIFSIMNSSKILCVYRSGIAGVEKINTYITGKINEQLELQERPWLPGTPVIINANDYKKGLFNGDTGIMLLRNSTYYGIFKKAGNYKAYPADTLPFCSPAFAVTVHKSQGSEYDNILLLLPDQVRGPHLSKEILYTALTRAKKLALVFSDPDHVTNIINRKSTRESGLSKIF